MNFFRDSNGLEWNIGKLEYWNDELFKKDLACKLGYSNSFTTVQLSILVNSASKLTIFATRY